MTARKEQLPPSSSALPASDDPGGSDDEDAVVHSSTKDNDDNNVQLSVALVGSSGGGTATLGHTDPTNLLQSIQDQLDRVCAISGRTSSNISNASVVVSLKYALFVSLENGFGLDSIQRNTYEEEGENGNKNHILDTTMATLYTIGCPPDSDNTNATTTDKNDNHKSSKSSAKRQHQQQYFEDVHHQQVNVYAKGNLRTINDICRRLDKNILSKAMLRDDNMIGLISISSDPLDVNRCTFEAAAAAICQRKDNGYKIAITGSGGTSLAAAAANFKGLTIVGNAGGSVATTTYTRAVSYVYALVDHWNQMHSNEANNTQNSTRRDTNLQLDYNPFHNPTNCRNSDNKPHIGSVLDSCLPAFVAVCVGVRILDFILILLFTKLGDGEVVEDVTQQMVTGNLLLQHFISSNNGRKDIFGTNMSIILEEIYSNLVVLRHVLSIYALPTVCCIVTSHCYVPEYGSLTLMISAIASIGGCGGSILASLFMGSVFIPWTVGRVLFHGCIKHHIPATMTNIIVGGGIGVFLAFGFQIFGITYCLNYLTDMILWFIQEAPLPHLQLSNNMMWTGQGIGFVLGCLFCYGSKVGWYHSIYLPLILLEMSRGQPSLLGIIDELTLVLVSAGICSANLVCSTTSRNVGNPSKSQISSCSATTQSPINNKHDSADDGNDEKEGVDHVQDAKDDDNSSSNDPTTNDSNKAICQRGLFINILCGDFIEVAYPFMESSSIVNIVSYIACGVSVEMLFSTTRSYVMGSAYLPLPLSIILARDPITVTIACGMAFGITFIGTLINNIIVRYTKK